MIKIIPGKPTGFMAGLSDESFDIGPETTENQAVASFKLENPDDKSCYLGKTKEISFLIDADSLLESITESISDSAEVTEWFAENFYYWIKAIPKQLVEEFELEINTAFKNMCDKAGVKTKWNIVTEARLIVL